MPPTPDVANRLTSMRVDEARLYYYKHPSPNLERLPPLSGSELECVGDVKPIRFDRDAISFIQSEDRNSAVVQPATGDYTLQSVTVEKPFEPVYWRNDEHVMVAHIICHGQPQCEFSAYRRKHGMPIARALPLGKHASQMHSIRVEFGDICSWWEVSRRKKKGWTSAAVQTQLERLFALYTASTLCGLDPEHGYEMPFHISTKIRPSRSIGHEALPWSEAESNTAVKPAQPSPSRGYPPKLPLPTSISPPTSRALTSTVLPQATSTSTILQNPRVLKRKLDEMIVHYDKIDEEEKKSMANCREKKEKLWAEWRSTDILTPSNPQHPAGLKRRLEEMEAKYDRIEDEEKEVTVHCYGKKEKLWEALKKGIPSGYSDDN